MNPTIYYLKRLLARLTVHTLSQARRLVRIVIGFTVLAIGVALIVLPGPAFVVIPIGLAILAGEFVWARRVINRFRYEATNFINRNRKKRRKR